MQIHKGWPILARLTLLNVDLYAFPLVYCLHSEPTGPYAMTDLPELSSLPELPQGQQFQVLDTLFEPSPELHTLMAPVLANQKFSSYDGLIDAVGGRMSALSAPNSPKDRDILFGILGSHPRLGRAPVPVAGHMSDLSKKEQEQLNTGAEEQAERLRGLNAEYEERFPGLRFVYDHCRGHPFSDANSHRTFVNGRSREAIMEEMRRRIDRGDKEREIEETIQVGCVASYCIAQG